MGWERPERGGFYIQKKRIGKRVVSRHIGKGEAAELIAQIDQLEYEKARALREAQRQLRDAIAERDQRNAAYFESVEVRLKQTLEAIGYHQDKNNTWRKRRHPRRQSSTTGANKMNQNEPETIAQSDHLKKSSSPKVGEEDLGGEGLPLIRLIEDNNPNACELFYQELKAKGIDNLFAMAVTDTLQQVRSHQYDDPLVQEAFRLKCNRMFEELGGRNASLLEKLVIERIIISWLYLHQIEIESATYHKQSQTLLRSEYYQRSINRGQKRYLAAIQALVQIQRLQIPVLQADEPQIRLLPGT